MKIISTNIVYNKGNITAFIDQSIVDYYYSLIHKYLHVIKPGHHAHITICRDFERPQFKEINHLVFYYTPIIHQYGQHFIINCYSIMANLYRRQCNLLYYRWPFNSFHFTVGFLHG